MTEDQKDQLIVDRPSQDSAEDQTNWQNQSHGLAAEAGEDQGKTGEQSAGLRNLGAPLPRNDVLYKVRGKARYADNISMENMLHGCYARSSEPHARILGINLSEAKNVPGVISIMTAADIPDDRLLVGTHDDDTPILAKDRVRYVGEPVVAILAESLDAAREACELVEIEYQSLPEIFTPEEAMAPGAIEIEEGNPGNIIVEHQHDTGDVDAAFRDADIVLEGTFTTEPIDHCFLEAQAGVAYIDSNGILTLEASTQYPHFHHQRLAHITGLPMEKIRVLQADVGAAFGGKIDNTIEYVACLFALQTGRPVKMGLTREEVFTTTTKRHRVKMYQKVAATKDGRLTALELDLLCDGGAYRSYSAVVAGRCVVHAGWPYRFPNQRVHLATTFTNHVPSGGMRSFGVVKTSFALEQHLNEIANRLGISPVEIRRINGFRDGDSSSTGQILQDVGLLKTLEAIGPVYEQKKREIDADTSGRKRGLGIACLGYGIGYSGVRNPSSATLVASDDGKIIAYTGTPDIGTGSDMALAQVAADCLGVDIGRIQVLSGDSSKTEDSGPTSASRTTYFSGNAIGLASEDFKRQFNAAVALKMGCSAEDVQFGNDQVIANGERMSFEQACHLISDEINSISGYGKFDPDICVDITTFKGNPYATYTYATHLVEIEVDPELGSVDVLNVWASHDGGVIVNPIGAEGQVHGGVAMGMGMALWEKIIREDGRIMNPHYRDYLLAGAKDMPAKVNVSFVDNYDRTGPYGAKGIAEAAIIPIPSAIACAITDAVGVKPRALPMESEQILKLMNER